MDKTTFLLIAGAGTVVAVGGYLLVQRRRRQKQEAAEMYHHFRCPGCKRRLRFQARQVGRKGRCSHCGHDIIFPPVSQSVD